MLSLLSTSSTGWKRSLALAVAAIALASGPARADEPGRGITAHFEIDYLKFVIDHHYSALRMTELAAGTDPTRDPALGNPGEGTSNTPGTGSTPAKAHSEELKSMARRENRTQREEIAEAQGFLKDWYGMSHEPSLSAMAKKQIQLLESTPAGAAFDHLFMETLSRHHYTITARSNECLVAADPEHRALHRYCSGIQHGQVNQINAMRDMLCQRFQICDYQPLKGLKGRHTDSDREPGSDSD